MQLNELFIYFHIINRIQTTNIILKKDKTMKQLYSKLHVTSYGNIIYKI